MLKSIKIVMALIFLSAFALNGQSLKGKVTDAGNGDPIIGAIVAAEGGKGTSTDLEGNYELKLEAGDYTIISSYAGYALKKQKISLIGNQVLDFQLNSKTTLDEVEIMADLAKIRETPVAVSVIEFAKVQEELGGRDLSMIANTTPGVYASENGGGSGDSRVTIRGVDQRNIAVLVDGVPVNDMETGNVFWSNWDGLNEVIKTMQIQRGLGASKLAISSLGGTMNIITKGIDQKESFTFKYELGTRNQNRIAFGYSNNFFNKKLGITFAASRKNGDAFPQATYIDSWSYFFKMQFRFHPKHLISIGANGAPQEHGQRLSNLNIIKYDTNYAKKIGIDLDSARQVSNANNRLYSNYGKDYNPGWGLLRGDQFVTNRNYYHKPLFTLNYTYSISSRITLSTLTYASFGNGGGTSPDPSTSLNASQEQFDFDAIYKANRLSNRIVKKYSETEYWASKYLRSSINNHRWFGGIASLTARITDNLTFLGGLDLRYYRGIHYRTPYDLIGADYVLDNGGSYNRNVFSNGNLSNFPTNVNKDDALKSMARRAGDKIEFHYDGFVKWGGTFGQIEYKKNRLSTFFTASFSQTEYKRVDYFAKKDIEINGQWQDQLIGYGDTAYYYNGETKVFRSNLQNNNNASSAFSISNGFIRFTNSGKKDSINIDAEKYTIESNNARFSTPAIKRFPGYTIKTGANYNLDDKNNVFANVGYLTIAPRFNNVYGNNNRVVEGVEIQKITAAEIGYAYRSKPLIMNVNAYYTDWKNRPVAPLTNQDGSVATINGLSVLLMGVEFDASAKLGKYFDLETNLSYGDWKYTSNNTAFFVDASNVITDTISIYAKGASTSDAAQSVYSFGIKYKPFKGFYIKPRFSFFSRHYANIDPSTLIFENEVGKNSWRIPDYYMIDLNFGYDFSVSGVKFTAIGNIFNILDATYITDARNGANFDAYTSTVFIGAGRRYNVGIRLNF